jgi:hypothetical protein
MSAKFPDRAEMERDTLRLLCSVLLKPGSRAEVCNLLTPGVFLDVTRRVVFEEICALGSVESRHLRQLLPARMTDRGFPEFNLAKLLGPKLVTEAQIESLVANAMRLLDLSNPSEFPLFETEDDVPN